MAPASNPYRMALLAGSLVVALAFAGCLNDFDEVRLNQVWIHGIDVSAPRVGSGTLTLLVNVTIENREASSGDLALEVKAHNTVTGLLVRTQQAEVGTIARDKSKTVPVPLDLPKEDGYRLLVVLFQDGLRTAQASGTVNQVGALSNTVVQSDLRVQTLEFLVRNVTDEKVRIDTQVYLTNEGDAPSRPLELHLKAREVTTGLLAAEAWTNVSGIPPEATQIRSRPLDVPDAYNYVVEAVLWDGDFIVGSGEGKVQLLPTFTVPKDEEVVVDRPQVEDFMRGDESGRGSADFADDQESGAPAPGLLLFLAAIVGALYWMRRRT